MEHPRDRMLDSAIVLLARRGYPGTSFGEVLAASGAPRGSIYHHFPGGKDALVAEAIARAGDRAVAILDGLEGADAVGVVDGFVALWRALLVHTDFAVGCSVLAVTVSADDDELIARAGEVFRGWIDRLAQLLAAGGVAEESSRDLATVLVASCEGAVVLARAARDLAPLDAVAAHLRAAVA